MMPFLSLTQNDLNLPYLFLIWDFWSPVQYFFSSSSVIPIPLSRIATNGFPEFHSSLMEISLALAVIELSIRSEIDVFKS